MTWNTLTEMLACQAETHPDHLFTRFVSKGEVVVARSYAQAWEWAGQWTALLVARGLRRGEVVILALPNCDDFIGAYFGTLLAGGVPAPVPPIRRPGADHPYLAVLAGRLRLLEARTLILPADGPDLAGLPQFASLQDLAILTRRQVPPPGPQVAPGGSRDDVALIQFTSGTAGSARAVKLSHKALLWQMGAIAEALALVDPARDHGVSWLPLYHDMGLIGFLFTPAFKAGGVTLLPTEEFIFRPGLWLRALSDFKGTITGGPPSAYALCGRRIKDSEVAGFDLSQVRVALVGAEMISPESLSQFADKFRPAGFRASSLMPTYGLAENALAVTMPPLGQGPAFDTVDLAMMERQGIAQQASVGESPDYPAPPDHPARTFTAVGEPLPGTEIAIVDEAGERLEERRVGEILVRSPSLMLGYHRQEGATRQALRGGWLWTGDLGYLAEGRLYITGRKKEILIVAGRKFHPEHLEQVASAVPGVRMSRVVAISSYNPKRSTENVILLAETRLAAPDERTRLRQSIRQALVQSGYPVSDVVLLRPGSLPFTSSGKLRRVECRTRFLTGEFPDDIPDPTR